MSCSIDYTKPIAGVIVLLPEKGPSSFLPIPFHSKSPKTSKGVRSPD